jgi:lantibiotic modifying enzyme
MKKLDFRTKNVIMVSPRYSKPLYSYKRDGIYINYGPLEGKNISKMYIENSEIVEKFIDNIFDSDRAPIRVIMDTIEVYKDLKSNYYNHEEGK